MFDLIAYQYQRFSYYFQQIYQKIPLFNQMYTPSSKWYRPQLTKLDFKSVTATYCTPSTNLNKLPLKNNPKNEQNLFKFKKINRYSSQEELKTYDKQKIATQTVDNSPKSHQNCMPKKPYIFPARKSNATQQKKTSSFVPIKLKAKSSIIKANNNFQHFKDSEFQQKTIKQLKQTSSTSSTNNLMTEVRSEKSIPTFLKTISKQKRKPQQKSVLTSKEVYLSIIFSTCELGINNFQIIQKLGQGKFASVYLAVDKRTGFAVALKVLQKKRIIEDNFLTQFIRQVKIQAYIDHPNIAKIYGFFQDETYFYSILELGEGNQLYDIIKKGEKLSQQSTSFIICNVLDAINHLHEKEILHRDIKPQNIVLVHGNIKLCDFGWAVYKKAELRSTFCGTPLYLSPELLNGQKYDEKVDLWALGVLAFQLHLGSSPFNIESQEDLLKIITHQIEYPKNCHVSKDFKDFVNAVLRKDPKERLDAKQLMELRFIKRYRQLQICEQLCQ